MNILLDTHIIIHSNAGLLSSEREKILENRKNSLYISQISLWEITKLCEHKHIIPEKGLQHLLISIYHHPLYTVVDFSLNMLLQLAQIAAKIHKDPADQIIMATALDIEAHIMTNDSRMKASKLVRTV